jgi:hypothetical protein
MTVRPARVFAALLALLAVLDVVILAIRAADVVTLGHFHLLSAEGPVLYAIWKVRTAHPLYEWPTRPYFALTLYNVLFYKTYAAIFSLLRVANDGTPVAGRLVTLAFAFAGAAGQYVAARRVAGPGLRVPLVSLSIVTWMGPLLPGWWAMGIRPDVPAAAISTWAVAAALAAFGGRTRGWLLLAGALFVLAWAFKQSQIALLVATCAYIAVWRRSLAELLLVAAPFAAGVTIAMLAGGAVYRANVIDAPRVNGLVPYLAIYWYRGLVLADLLLWGLSLYAIVALVRPGSVHGPLRSLDDVPERSRKVFGSDLTYPALAACIACAWGAVLLAKPGSALNHTLELNVAASCVCAAVLGSAWRSPKAARVCTVGALMLAPMIAFDAVLLVNDSGPAASALLLKSWGVPLHLTTPEAAREREAIAAIVDRLPRPLFTDDELFAQPWHATGNTYPTVLLDHVFYDTASPMGLVGRGVRGLFEDRYFAAAVIPDSSAFVTPAFHAGYRLAGTIPRRGDSALKILLRDK